MWAKKALCLYLQELDREFCKTLISHLYPSIFICELNKIIIGVIK